MLSSVLGRPREAFREVLHFCKLFSVFVKFCTSLYMGKAPSIGPNPNILTGVKEVVKSSLLANFRKGSSIFPSIMSVFVKF